jgi:hypothetical protein
MEHSKDKHVFLAKVDQDYFHGGGALMLKIAFSGVYNLTPWLLWMLPS